jgi:hypothetical protein
MDLKGNTCNIEITVEKDSKGYNIFSSPEFVTTNSHSIYVSDCRNNVVLRFNWQGEMIGLVGIKEPMGITLLHDGSLLVNECSSDCIYRVSGDCKDSKTILQDADSPYASSFCVSRLKDDSDDNYITLYKMM